MEGAGILLKTIRPKRTPFVFATRYVKASLAICKRVLRPIGAPFRPFRSEFPVEIYRVHVDRIIVGGRVGRYIGRCASCGGTRSVPGLAEGTVGCVSHEAAARVAARAIIGLAVVIQIIRLGSERIDVVIVGTLS